MGLMDNIKNAQELAKQSQDMVNDPEMQKAMAASQNMPVPSAEEQEQVDFQNRVVNEGLDGEGTITAIKETGKVDPTSQAKQFEIDLEANVGADPYAAKSLIHIEEKNMSYYTEGSKWQIKADPGDKARVVVLQIIND